MKFRRSSSLAKMPPLTSAIENWAFEMWALILAKKSGHLDWNISDKPSKQRFTMVCKSSLPFESAASSCTCTRAWLWGC
eukprot:7712876-Alexandrium_andersonii.AAC.1